MTFNCRLCGAPRFAMLETQSNWLTRASKTTDERKLIGEIVTKSANLDFDGIVRCLDCGLASVQTCPTPEALGQFYADYYASHSYATKRDKKIKRARNRIKRLRRKISGRRFLDVGSNLGFAVEAARLEDFDAFGVEIDPQAVAAAEKEFASATFTVSTVEDFAKTGQQFDLIFCTEVIEHVENFKSFADGLLTLLAPGGLLFLTTPADGHRATPIPLVSWVQVKPPEHLTWLQRDHLKLLFNKPGYRWGRQINFKPGHKLVIQRDRD